MHPQTLPSAFPLCVCVLYLKMLHKCAPSRMCENSRTLVLLTAGASSEETAQVLQLKMTTSEDTFQPRTSRGIDEDPLNVFPGENDRQRVPSFNGNLNACDYQKIFSLDKIYSKTKNVDQANEVESTSHTRQNSFSFTSHLCAITALHT